MDRFPRYLVEMSYCVFMHRSDSIYDDSPAVQYQFPKPYLGRAQTCIGDWVVYLEPTKVRDSRGYFGIARIQEIIPDPATAGMFLALVEPGSYLPFSQTVSFNEAAGPIESGLLNDKGKLSGRAQAAIRPISNADFLRIIEKGLEDSEPILPRIGDMQFYELQEPHTPFQFEQDRERVLQLTSRVVRDRVFRKIVLKAYDERCAFTGLKLINGGGRAEVNAAHIRPVEKDGPDIISNGIALSGTAHWMFDRGLISLSDELEIQISRHVNNLDDVSGFLNKSGSMIAPVRSQDRPHPAFLAWHRNNCFKL